MAQVETTIDSIRVAAVSSERMIILRLRGLRGGTFWKHLYFLWGVWGHNRDTGDNRREGLLILTN